MDVYRTNCILFAQTALWSLATWSSTTSSSIEIVGRLNYAGYANSHPIRARAPLGPPLAENGAMQQLEE